MSKRPDTDPIVLDDIDPNSDWVVETQPPEFGDDIDVELEDVLDADRKKDFVVSWSIFMDELLTHYGDLRSC